MSAGMHANCYCPKFYSLTTPASDAQARLRQQLSVEIQTPPSGAWFATDDRDDIPLSIKVLDGDLQSSGHQVCDVFLCAALGSVTDSYAQMHEGCFCDCVHAGALSHGV